MEKIKDFKDLIVWQKSMDLVEEVYRLVKNLPKEELYSLSDQIKRSAISIPSNIAEGQGRKSAREFIRFLRIARASKAELETQLLLCVRINYLNTSDIDRAIDLIQEIGKMLNSLQKSLLLKC
ncbi:MAG: four helix bundle protein [Bacteroidales bacterium]|jgi:four helix bundle protein|nr:four helix bundle protein [Bacteroidales bacterium]MCK9499786.1 four helix bundle protein [Bacteroidales bacterium]MDY0315857.1 four helix bundle protein [Bacteroidales bacterium]